MCCVCGTAGECCICVAYLRFHSYSWCEINISVLERLLDICAFVRNDAKYMEICLMLIISFSFFSFFFLADKKPSLMFSVSVLSAVVSF